ncbi:MAG: hypothetical protein B6D55_02560 [Candidatus Omnitrophica bacterium 4484_70.2]|nr:MAG: hypothetical protein B6D55_02560 [Candidatus Omnitrophica bacterium 4484_70.2]
MKKQIIGLIIFFLLLSPSLFAQNYRKEAVISPVYIYQQMLSFVKEGNYDKIVKSLPLLEDVLNAIKNNFNKDLKILIEEAVSTRDAGRIKKAIYTLIYYDIKDVFNEVLTNLNTKGFYQLKETLKFAYLDYLLVSPAIRKRNFKIDREIRKSFVELLGGLLAKAVEEKSSIFIEGKFSKIEENYKSILGID